MLLSLVLELWRKLPSSYVCVVAQMAAALLTKPVLCENLPSLHTAKPLVKRFRCRPGSLQQYGPLLEWRVTLPWDLPVSSRSLHRLGHRDRQPYHADVGSAELHELRGLRDILAEHQLALH